MEISTVNVVCFSPTDSTKTVSEFLTAVWDTDKRVINITDRKAAAQTYEFLEDELVYFGVPSYGGRVPTAAADRLKQMKGNRTPAVIVTTFGNRDYEDTLLELKNIVHSNGFVVISAVAAVTEHSIMHQFAAGRPDETDRRELADFSKRIKEKVGSIQDIRKEIEVNVKGNENYREYHGIPLKPHIDKACTKCGICAEKCPVGAIPKDNPAYTDKGMCISCMRCIKVCPKKSRSLNKIMLFFAGRKMKKVCGSAKKNECYL